MKEVAVKDRWMMYVIASVLIHGAILSIPAALKAPRPVEPIEVFVLDGDGSSSPGGGGGGEKQDTPGNKPHRGTPGPVKKEAVDIRPSQRFAKPVEHKTEPLPPTTAGVPGNEAAVYNDSIGAPGPETGPAMAGRQGAPGTGAGGSGAGGASTGTGGGNGGTGAGSGSGQGNGAGGGGVGFGSPGGPRFLRREVPEYPFPARKRGKEGSVLLAVTIDAAGRLIKVEVIEASDKVFVEPSLEAVRKSTFLPARRNNRPIDCKALLPIRFSLTE